jgi:hypothetical protein
LITSFLIVSGNSGKFSSVYKDSSVKDYDPWWQFSGAVKEFNTSRLERLRGDKFNVVDESMCAYCPQTTRTGGQFNGYFVKRNP